MFGYERAVIWEDVRLNGVTFCPDVLVSRSPHKKKERGIEAEGDVLACCIVEVWVLFNISVACLL
jgi:hypothetical protein